MIVDIFINHTSTDQGSVLVPSTDDRSETRQFAIRYERMWERSQSMPGVHTLGL
jgi:hypothetical protein